MAAGDLLVAPGQIEWAGLLFDIRPADYWLSVDSEVEGWDPAHETADRQTIGGGVSGLPRPTPMYPTIVGLCVDTDVLLRALMATMEPTYTESALCWWDYPTNQVFKAMAAPRRRAPVRAQGSQLLPHRLIDLQWFIGDPGGIEVIEDDS